VEKAVIGLGGSNRKQLLGEMDQTGHKENNHTPSLASLFFTFLKLGITAFGGPAMVAYIRKMAVEKRRWLSEQSFKDGVSLCQTLPGATAMQIAAYVGLRGRGMAGAAASYVGFGLPAFLLMMTFSALYVRAHTLPTVVSIFSGLQAIIVAIIANATISFGKNSLKNWQAVLIAFISATLFRLRISPILVILLAAVLGILLYSRQVLSQTTADPKIKVGLQNSLLWLLLAVAVGFIFLFFADQKLFDLATLMFRIDLSAFGGGFASVPLMFHEVVDVHSWLDAKTFLDGIALGQVTPGPIVITATFIGYLLNGVLGGLIATLSIFLPSYILVVGITPYFDKLRNSPYFSRAISGILSSFVGLLLSVTIRFALDIPWDLPRTILAGGAFIALLFKVEIYWVVIVTTPISIFILR